MAAFSVAHLFVAHFCVAAKPFFFFRYLEIKVAVVIQKSANFGFLFFCSINSQTKKDQKRLEKQRSVDIEVPLLGPVLLSVRHKPRPRSSGLGFRNPLHLNLRLPVDGALRHIYWEFALGRKSGPNSDVCGNRWSFLLFGVVEQVVHVFDPITFAPMSRAMSVIWIIFSYGMSSPAFRGFFTSGGSSKGAVPPASSDQIASQTASACLFLRCASIIAL